MFARSDVRAVTLLSENGCVVYIETKDWSYPLRRRAGSVMGWGESKMILCVLRIVLKFYASCVCDSLNEV